MNQGFCFPIWQIGGTRNFIIPRVMWG